MHAGMFDSSRYLSNISHSKVYQGPGSSIKDVASNCQLCRQTAEQFDRLFNKNHSSSSYADPNPHCYFEIGKATEYQHHVSCTTCQGIWHLLDDQRCPRTKYDETSSTKSICVSCTIHLHYNKMVPVGYGYYLLLEVSGYALYLRAHLFTQCSFRVLTWLFQLYNSAVSTNTRS